MLTFFRKNMELSKRRCYTITLTLSELINEGQFDEFEPIFRGFVDEFNRETDLLVKIKIAQIWSVQVGGVSFMEELEVVSIPARRPSPWKRMRQLFHRMCHWVKFDSFYTRYLIEMYLENVLFPQAFERNGGDRFGFFFCLLFLFPVV